MRPSTAAVVVGTAVVLVLGGPVAASPAPTPPRPAAACAAAQLVASPDRGGPGDTVTLRGTAFLSACRDTGEPGESPSREGIELVLEQGGRSAVLAVVDARDGGGFSSTVVLPASAEPGTAVLVARQAGYGTVTTPFTVVPSVGSRPASEELPRTGPREVVTASGGTALVALGVALLLAGGRRRRRTAASDVLAGGPL